jgi:hypothetical protein
VRQAGETDTHSVGKQCRMAGQAVASLSRCAAGC